MKKLLLVSLLSSLLIFAKAQEYKALKVLGTVFGAVVLNGIGDGLNDNGQKGWGHAVNALSYATLIGGTIWSEPERKDWLRHLIIYGGVRYVFFDASYNLTRDLPVNYIGTTAWSDKAQAKVPAHFRTFTKTVVGCVTIGFTFNEFSYKKVPKRNTNF
jgi:hypothetical protein